MKNSGIYSTDVNNLEYLITAYFDLSTAQTDKLAVPRGMDAYGPVLGLFSIIRSLLILVYKKK